MIGALIGGLPAGVVAGVVLLVVGIAGLGQAAAAFSAAALGWPIAKMWGFTGALGRQNAVRHPGRTAASAAAVVVGVALICALAVIASSARASSNDELSRTVLADYVLTAAGAGPSEAVLQWSRRWLRASSPDCVLSPEWGGLSLVVSDVFVDGRGSDWGATIDLSTYRRVVGLGPLQGSLAGLRTGRCGGREEFGRRSVAGTSARCCRLPSSPRTAAQRSTSSFRISALFDSEGYYGGFLFSAATLASTYPKLQPSLVFVSGDRGTTPSATRLAVARALTGYPEVSVSDPAEVQATQDQVIDRQIDLAAVLSLLALIIGYLGIVTNLTLSITERVRELGLLPRPRDVIPPDRGSCAIRVGDHRCTRRLGRHGPGAVRGVGPPTRSHLRRHHRAGRPLGNSRRLRGRGGGRRTSSRGPTRPPGRSGPRTRGDRRGVTKAGTTSLHLVSSGRTKGVITTTSGYNAPDWDTPGQQPGDSYHRFFFVAPIIDVMPRAALVRGHGRNLGNGPGPFAPACSPQRR